MKVLVTGGAGHIGSHIAERHLLAGDEVKVLDDMSTGRVCNMSRCRQYPRFEFVYGTILDELLVARLVDWSDIVYHMAATVGVKLILREPVRTIRTNVDGTGIVLTACARRGKRVLIASTSEVYGKGDTLPFREDSDLVLGPTSRTRWGYACTKLLDEFLALAYNKETSLPVTVARLFNTVGSRQTGAYGMVLPTFVGQAKSDKPITVYGDGSQTRCFIHVSDAVDTLVKLMDCEEAEGEVVNVGSTEEVSILRLAEKICKASGGMSVIKLVPYAEAYADGFEDMTRRVPDTTKAERLVGHKITINIDDIVADAMKDGTLLVRNLSTTVG